ncbi:type II secretion system F family protein [Georgenia sp. Z1344]|uniref:type II secretion system F family protein n=1 Tax=Georgenia sp. Z1344 TaxID=3416706 RepID=UPI003CE73162
MNLQLLLLALAAVAPWLLTRPAPEPEPPHRPELPGLRLDPAVLLDLCAATLAAGSSVPGALRALGDSVAEIGDGTVAGSLCTAGELLLLGAPWEEAWADVPPDARALADCLEPAWNDGADPGPLLDVRATNLRADRARVAEEAAARLGVRLVLPLGLCFLPAFVLLGILPVVLGAGLDLLGG